MWWSLALASADAAWLLIRTWNGIDGAAEPGQGHSTKVNNWTGPDYGANHFYSYDKLPIPVSALKSGDNTITVDSTWEDIWDPSHADGYVTTGDDYLFLGDTFDNEVHDASTATVYDSNDSDNGDSCYEGANHLEGGLGEAYGTCE